MLKSILNFVLPPIHGEAGYARGERKAILDTRGKSSAEIRAMEKECYLDGITTAYEQGYYDYLEKALHWSRLGDEYKKHQANKSGVKTVWMATAEIVRDLERMITGWTPGAKQYSTADGQHSWYTPVLTDAEGRILFENSEIQFATAEDATEAAKLMKTQGQLVVSAA